VRVYLCACLGCVLYVNNPVRGLCFMLVVRSAFVVK